MNLPKPAKPNSAPVRPPEGPDAPKHPTEERLINRRPPEDDRRRDSGEGESGSTEA